ncbi:hypothetical protein CYY_005364 [Polysphondylium violaceum]|uniref:Cysteine proteinase n=1 Tax=Polysphondylium violaceum TaxID=133409 RepID=A0A8J4PTW5_9MYCE|nr:hypothetical protein CYY_005364 [Polysphondylium violaceum]
MKSILLIALFIALASASFLTKDEVNFINFQQKYNKVYESHEYAAKFATFKSNVGLIESLNQKAKAQNSDLTFGVNKFADLSPAEFRKYYMSAVSATPSADLPMAAELSDDIINATPVAFDWREHGAVTPVKNQGQCGSCWTFSTTGNVEGQNFLAAKNPLVGLSEQNLVDCSNNCMEYENQKVCNAGCDGGLQPIAYEYIIQAGGIDTEQAYPYTAVDGTCKFDASSVGAKITSYTMVPTNETQIAAFLATTGPLAIAADAAEWQFYLGGVFDIPCGKSLDHGILIVGYSAQRTILGANTPYWIVKNSWGADWGEAGYLKVLRNKNECGVANFVSTSIISAQ